MNSIGRTTELIAAHMERPWKLVVFFKFLLQAGLVFVFLGSLDWSVGRDTLVKMYM